jgi:hypothetical protein
MSAMIRRILRRTSKDFRDELGDVLEMSGVHVPEEGLEKRVGRNLFVEPFDERTKNF